MFFMINQEYNLVIPPVFKNQLFFQKTKRQDVADAVYFKYHWLSWTTQWVDNCYKSTNDLTLIEAFTQKGEYIGLPILKIILNFFMPDGNKRSELKAACLFKYVWPFVTTRH